jgi:mRNA interferase ChpB
VRRGDIFLVSLDPTSGHEQQGTRPALVITPDSYNRLTNAPIVAPITTGGQFARIAGLTVSLSGVGLRTTGVVRCDQLRTIDLTSRKARFLETAPEALVQEVLEKVISFLSQ